MKILIVSGFLGAGKTTFIQALTKAVPRDFAVYENEFGQTNMDASLLRAGDSSDKLNVWEMAENCVCCTGKSDFLSTLLVIQNSLDPEILIVEPTGVAKLGNILNNIQSLHYDRLEILKPVTIVDTEAFLREKEEHGDLFLDQVKNASTIILSKSENMGNAELAKLFSIVRTFNSTAAFYGGNYRANEAAWWNNLLEAPYVHETSDPKGSSADTDISEDEENALNPKLPSKKMETFTLKGVTLPTPVHLMYILDLTVGDIFGKIPRAKGCLPCGQEWIRFDAVDRSWSITAYQPMDESVCTFIGTEINRRAIRRYFGNVHVARNVTTSEKKGAMRA
jgi:G3E family GTPase